MRALGDRFVRTEAVMRGGEREDREGLEEGEGRVWLVGGARGGLNFEHRRDAEKKGRWTTLKIGEHDST